MKALDTNILVRFLTRDDEEQFQKASKFLSQFSENNQAFITTIVLVELVWTLRATYKYSSEQISLSLTGLLVSKELQIEHSDEAQRANELYLEGESEGFADAYSGLIALKEGCSGTTTFDQRASRLEFYELLK